MVSTATIVGERGERPVALLAPLAVVAAWQRRGIGGDLVRAAAAAVSRSGGTCVVLEGDPGYYGQLGFVPAARFGLVMPLPDWAPVEAAQLLPLDGFDPDDPTLRGTVRYGAAFDALPE